MLKVYGVYQIVRPGEWRQTIKILHQGKVIGYLERERTRHGRFTRTRNLQGVVMEGVCLEWLLNQSA